MSLHGFNNFVIQVLGIENESEWLHSEKVNIFITAIIPAFFTFLTALIPIIKGENIRRLLHYAKNDIFIDSLQLVVIVCTIIVLFRVRRKILITKAKNTRLISYIRENVNLRDKSDESVEKFLYIVKKIMSQFYYAWFALWVIFFVYYSGELCYTILHEIDFEGQNTYIQVMIRNNYNNLFNYLSSTAMFVLFIILNSVTVSMHERKTGHGLTTAVSFIVLFGCLILLPSMYSYSLEEWSFFKLELIITIILGIYSALSFVLVLGKLNTNLQIPRFIFYWLYFYALIQTFEFLFTFLIIKDNYCWCYFSEFKPCLESFEKLFQYITIVGKVFLSLTLLWISYDSKIILFVIQQSQAITELHYRKVIFKTYMKDVD